jgi:hypothetical protein
MTQTAGSASSTEVLPEVELRSEVYSKSRSRAASSARLAMTPAIAVR